MALLEASGIGKNFGDTKVLKDISLTLEQGEALAIIGSSGSGKTTLLRCLNFLERPDTGIIKVNGETMWDAADPATQRESEIRKKRLHFGLVFQNFNLFPQYTALQNVMLAGELLAKERPDYKANKKAIHAELEQQAQELLARWAFLPGQATTRTSFPAVSSSAWPLPRTGSAPGHSLLRRADLGPRPGADRRGAARPARPCRPQDHHDHRHPRDALCP